MTVRKVVRRGETRLFIDITWKDPSGKKHRYRQDAQVQTMAAAKAEERRLIAHLGEHGKLPEPEAPKGREEKVEAVLFTAAIEAYRDKVAPTKKPSTMRGYDDIIDAVLEPRFGETPLASVDAAAVAQFDADLARKGASASRRRNLQVVLRTLLRSAVLAGLLPEMPRLPSLPKVGRTVVDAFPIEHLPKVLEAAGPQARLAFALAAYAGLRAGEVRGLRWCDVDLKSGLLVVRRAVSHGIEASPKSGHERVVPLAEPLAKVLEATPRGAPAARVALTRDGKEWGEWGLALAFKRALKRAELPMYRFHSLRHLFVTGLFRGGAGAHTVKALAGHASLDVTQRYAHVVESELRAAVAALGQRQGNGP